MKIWVKIAIPVVFLLFLFGFIGWRIAVGRTAKPVKTITASYQTVTKDIAFTGNTEATQSSDVAFEVSGTVKKLFVQVGDTVQPGQLLASIDPQSAALQIAKAQADKASAASVAYTTWQNALQSQKDTAAENTKLIDAKKQAVRDAKATLQQASNVYAQKQSETQSQDYATLAVQTGVVADQAAYNAAQAALTSATQSVKTSNNTAKRATDIAYKEYINTQQASAETAGLSSLDALTKIAQINALKSTIRAPFAGVVTQKNSEIGEFAVAGNPIITIATIHALQISADVPETDALTLSQDMHASITFDALPNQTIDATVTQIYPAAKSIQGVPTFHVVLNFTSQNAALRAGITANIIVHAAKKDHVIAIPRRAIATKSGKTYVTKQTGSTTSEVEVKTGLVGSDGLEEITSGVQDGDILVSQ
ncbi:MAG TPA: efflux RND transporter periplasmic adaptor subunit [Candidatus Andersenbacteria bacterium]|nr:efflux RND transporter periplasmic adaptor subunit [Candidatus Andersenbacteria bacterium]